MQMPWRHTWPALLREVHSRGDDAVLRRQGPLQSGTGDTATSVGQHKGTPGGHDQQKKEAANL